MYCAQNYLERSQSGKNACAKSEKNTCMFHLFFTTGDEAFLLLVLNKFTERWYAEKKWECAEKW